MSAIMSRNSGIVVHRLGAGHRQADITADPGGLVVQVVQHLDVIADESDGTEDGGPEAALVFTPQVRADVRFEPRIARPAATALVHQPPVADARFLRDQPC